MLYFQTVRTARFSFTLQELSLADSRALLNIDPSYIEKARTEFLKRALKEFHWHSGNEHLTLEDLTIQERMFIESTYLSSVSDYPDFLVSNGKYTDYLIVEKQFNQPFYELGVTGRDPDKWHIRQMTGLMIEAVEQRVLARDASQRIDWILYAMAAQMYQNEPAFDPKVDFTAYGDWLDNRVEVLQSLPASEFVLLLDFFFEGLEKLEHLFKINFDSEGVQVISETTMVNEEGEEVEVLPARFHPFTKVDVITQKLLGKYHQDNE